MAAKPEEISADEAGSWIVRETVVDAVEAAAFPAMAMGKVPVGAPMETASVTVVLHPGVQVPGENDAVTPLGREDAVKETGPGAPEISAALMAVL